MLAVSCYGGSLFQHAFLMHIFLEQTFHKHWLCNYGILQLFSVDFILGIGL